MTGEYARPVLFEDPNEGPTTGVITPVPETLPAGSEGHITSRVKEGAGQPKAPVSEPLLLNMPEGLSAGREDQDWAPGMLQVRKEPRGSLGWVAGGLTLIMLGGLVLSAVGFVSGQFARSAMMGWSTVLVLGVGLLAVLWGLWREMEAFQRLRQVDALRTLLSRGNGPVAPAWELALVWLKELERVLDLARAGKAAAAAPDIPLLRAVLRKHLAGPLAQATRQAGNRAALEGGMVVAISPSPALDGC